MPTPTGITGWTQEMQDEMVRLIDGLSSMRNFRVGLVAYFTFLLDSITEGGGPMVVANNTGGDLLAGVCGYIASSEAGGLPEIGLADADVSGRPCQFILGEDIATGSSGLAYGIGVIIGVDTSAWAEDTKLYSSATAGALTNTAPSGSDDRQQEVAMVELQATAALGGRIRVYPELTSQQVVGTSELQDDILSADAAGRAKMAADYFNAATVLTHFDANSIDNANADLIFIDDAFAADDVSRAKFAASFLGNSAIGRALMETGFFSLAKALDAFAADSMDNTFTDAVFAAAAFAADADSRAIFADGIWTPAKLQASLIAGAFSMAVLGDWGAAVDGVETNGGGMCGFTPVLTNAAQAYCKVYDIGSTTYSDLALSSALAGWAANYQLTADAASEEVGDKCMFGDDDPFCEIGLDLAGALATWGADGGVWEYWNGAAFVAIPAGTFYDNMDTTAELTGLRSFQQAGAFTFMPPTDWAASTEDGQLAYWIQYRITALQVTQTPITNNEEHSVITPLDGFNAPWDGIVDTVHLADAAAVLHSTLDVLFFVMNHSTNESTGILTFAQDQRTDTFVGESLAVNEGDKLAVHCVQGDGAAEPTGVMLSCQGTRA